MRKLIRGADVFVYKKEKLSEYEDGAMLLGREIKSLLEWQYIISRLEKQLPPDPNYDTSNLDQFVTLKMISALNRLSALSLRKLIEENNDSLNFHMLHKTIRKQINHSTITSLETKIKEFQNRWDEFKKYGNIKGAHIGKSGDQIIFWEFVNIEHAVNDAMILMDEFVEGEVFYIIETIGGNIDLRNFIEAHIKRERFINMKP